MRSPRPFRHYRPDLKPRARALRHDLTPAERRLWYEFLAKLPDKFTRQKPLGQYIADFYCANKRLVIEVDGDSHFTDASERYDRIRTQALDRMGLAVLRFTNAEVMHEFDAVCARIGEALIALASET